MNLTPATVRLDLKCGKGAISKGEKCTKGAATAAKIALGVGVAAGLTALYLRQRRQGKGSSSATAATPTPAPTPAPIPNARTQRNTESARRASQEMADRLAARRVRTTPAAPTPTPPAKPPQALRVEIPEGWRDVVRNEKHNYVIGKHPDFNAILGKSITPEGNTIDFKLSSTNEVEFRVNGDTNRRQNFNRQEGSTILTRVERMLQASIKDLPDNDYIWTNAYSNDGLGKKREKLYKRYGFQSDPADPSSTELGTTVGALKRKNRRNDALTRLTPDSRRLDLKCGKGAISEGEKCSKGPATKGAIAAGIGLTAGAVALGAVALNKRGRSTRPSSSTSANPVGPSPTPLLPGLSPRALLKAAPPRQSKTQRMRANTAAAVKNAEGRIAQTASEEVRRIAQIGNTMAAAGEAAGMATKLTARNLRLRVEAARRKYEPGYRRPDQRRLPEGVQAQLPQSTAPRTREAIPFDPRTGQPSRRKAQGFGRTDNYIQHYAPVQLQPPTRRDACWEGYEQVGMKPKGKRQVPNCVPISRKQNDTEDGKKYTKVVTNPETGRKNKVRYGAKGYTIAPGTDKGDRYCARSFGDMKSEGYNCAGAERNTPLCLSRAKWRCSGKTSRRS